MSPKISIVIPVFNNDKTIEELVALIDFELENFNYEIILIDDGSIDNSWIEIEKLITGKKNKAKIIGLKFKKNYGQENAKMAGLRATKGHYIVFMDADLQHHPKYILKLIEKCDHGFDVCYANFKSIEIRPLKYLGSLLYNFCSVLFLKKPIGIYLSSYCLMRKEIRDVVVDFVNPLINIDAIVLANTKRISQINTKTAPKKNKETNYTFPKMLALFFKLLPGFSTFPLKTIGGFCLFIILGITLFLLNNTTVLVIQNISQLKIIFISLSLLTLFLIAIAFYVAKIYLALQNSKQYEIEKTEQSDS